MENDRTPAEVDPRGVARIVGSYVRRHKIEVAQLPVLISEVQRSLADLGRAAGPTPAVPVKRSVQPYHVICLECGFHAQMLRRHLRFSSPSQAGHTGGDRITGMRLWISAHNSFGAVVMMVKLRTTSSTGDFQVSHKPASAMTPPPASAKA
jgi:hypothetical protein